MNENILENLIKWLEIQIESGKELEDIYESNANIQEVIRCNIVRREHEDILNRIRNNNLEVK